MLIANILKGKMNSQQLMNASWIVTTIKAILKEPIEIFENTIFLFRRTHEAAVRNIKILAAFNGDLGADILEQKDIPGNYGSEFCSIASLEKLLHHH